MATRGKEIRIAVMGATGSGKSTFINLASGSNLPVGRGLESCTSDVHTSRPFLLNGRIVTLIDTPGFDDTSRSDTDILSSIAAYLSNTYEQGAKLAGIIYMHRISDVRIGGTSKRNFRIFRELCGDSTLRNVLIVTNMWSNVDPKIGEARERELANNDKFFKPVLEKGARLLRHNGTQPSALSVLRHLINNQAATLLIQHEIVNERKDLAHTAAGAELTRALKEQADRHDEELKKLRQEMEVAMRAKDEETKSELQEEVDRKREEVERIQRDSERMAADFIAEKVRLESKIAEMEDENRRRVRELEGLQEQVLHARKEVETSQVEHARRETELQNEKKEAEERKARLLEEERKARELAEARHQEHLRSLQQEMLRAEAEKKQAEADQAEKIRLERERALALEAELKRQAKVREEEEKARQLEEERERARLQAEIAEARQEMERISETYPGGNRTRASGLGGSSRQERTRGTRLTESRTGPYPTAGGTISSQDTRGRAA
ncbi:P-loop containing nucleoside triphosphate hydrolase protein [Boletus edulis]|nr:P-loop containing nucleoside triphosphate hydrolase protein [Boletus edulis]